MRAIGLVSSVVTILVLSAAAGFPACDPTTEPDRSDVANARVAVEAVCPCAAASAHGTYVSCVVQQALAVLANPGCAASVKQCARKSTCGRPGVVTCCRTSNGRTRCSLKRSAARCLPPHGGQACVGSFTSCCDACGASGCTPTTTTTTTTSTLPPGCGNGQIDAGEDCDGAALGLCGGLGCGDPSGSVACHCCIPNGATFVAEGPCCDGSFPTVIGPHAFVCPNPSGTCEPPSVCEIGACQPDHTCCAGAGGECAFAYPPPIQYSELGSCCAGSACRSISTPFPGAFAITCCTPDGASCASDGACCTGHCTGGVCDQCRAPGAACASDGECCTPFCASGVCGPCFGSGNICTDGVQCCSGSCNPATHLCSP